MCGPHTWARDKGTRTAIIRIRTEGTADGNVAPWLSATPLERTSGRLFIKRPPEPIRIIIIDDDESIRKAANRLLSVAGYIVQTFASAEELVETGSVNDECLILDLRSPSMMKLKTAVYDALTRAKSDQRRR